MKKKTCIILSFCIPIAIYFFSNILAKNGLNFCSYLPDFDSQYIPLYKWAKGVYLLDNSIIYSFSKGLGGSMWAAFFYYLSSPLNIFVVFFKDINFFLNFLILIKIGACGLCMYIYLSSKHKDKYVINLAFSLCYALMGYNICYIKNIFWFDVVYIAPIVLLGIDRIFEQNNSKLYIISLAYAILCNFYTAYSLCIFCVLYFFYNLVLKQNISKIKVIKKFIISSLLCGGICAFFLIPTIYELFQLKNRTFSAYFLTNFIYIPYHYLIGSSDVRTHQFLLLEIPNLYVSLFVFILYVSFFLSNKFSKKEKAVTLIIELFFLSTVFFQPIYNFWHGFSGTSGNAYRFSYIWSLFQIIIAYRTFNNLKFDNKLKRNLYILLLCFILFNVVLYINSSAIFYNHGLEIIFSLIFIIFYYQLLFNNRLNKLLLFIVIAELSINCVISVHYPSRHLTDYDKWCFNNVDNYERVITDETNVSLYCGYGSSSTYLSTNSSDIINFFHNIGSDALGWYVNGSNDTELINSLIGIDYYNKDLHKVEKNDYALSFGYMVYNNKCDDKSVIKFQEKLLNSMTNQNLTYFKPYPITEKNKLEYIFYNNNHEKYLVLNYKMPLKAIYLNGEKIYNNVNSYLPHIIRLQTLNASENKIYLKLLCNLDDDDCEKPDLKLYEFDTNNFEKAINVLKEQQLNVTKMEKNELEGDIKVTKDNQYLFLSIPYEKGWNIYIDGKKVNYEKIYDAFIGIKLDKGKHNIKMIFYPYGLKIGIAISLVSVVICIIYVRKSKK